MQYSGDVGAFLKIGFTGFYKASGILDSPDFHQKFITRKGFNLNPKIVLAKMGQHFLTECFLSENADLIQLKCCVGMRLFQ